MRDPMTFAEKIFRMLPSVAFEMSFESSTPPACSTVARSTDVSSMHDMMSSNLEESAIANETTFGAPDSGRATRLLPGSLPDLPRNTPPSDTAAELPSQTAISDPRAPVPPVTIKFPIPPLQCSDCKAAGGRSSVRSSSGRRRLPASAQTSSSTNGASNISPASYVSV